MFDPSTLQQTFADDFNSLNLYNSSTKTGTWDTSYYGNTGTLGCYTLTGNGEFEIYVAPGFQGTSGKNLGLSPFTLNSNSTLTITAQKVSNSISQNIWNYEYTSGVLTTKDTFSQTYGYFEIRAQLPVGQGLWPAFWLVPTDGSWPPELDVMEVLGNNLNIVYTTVHTNVTGSPTQIASANNITGDMSGFHTYGALWTPTAVTFYVDRNQVFTTPTPSDMNKPMYMIVNLAVGGWNGGPSGWTSAQMIIDYVHVYSLKANNVLVGKGNDTFVVSNTNTIIEENAGGYNTVQSSIDFVLPTGIQSLVLTGNTNINGFGMNMDEALSGNDGNNVLVGGAGDDWIAGGKGNDILVGGGGNDTFGFGPGDGNDIIADWHYGNKLYIPMFKAIGIIPVITQHGADTIIIFTTGDSITLKNTLANSIQTNSDGTMLFGVKPS